MQVFRKCWVKQVPCKTRKEMATQGLTNILTFHSASLNYEMDNMLQSSPKWNTFYVLTTHSLVLISSVAVSLQIH